MKRIALYKQCLLDLPFRERVQSNPTLERIYSRPGVTTRRFMNVRETVFTRNLERYLADALDPIFLKYKACLGEGALRFVEYSDLPPRKEKYKAGYMS